MSERQTPPRTLALVGMSGSGKTVCAAYLQDKGYFQFRFGSIIVDEVQRRGLEVKPDNEKLVREEFRTQDGMDAIAKRALPILKAQMANHTTIIIDGLYSFSEYKTLRRELGDDMVVLAIVAPRQVRYQRLATRPVRPLTPAEAELRDFAEIESIEKGGPIAIADYTIVNDSDPANLYARLDALLNQLGITAP